MRVQLCISHLEATSEVFCTPLSLSKHRMLIRSGPERDAANYGLDCKLFSLSQTTVLRIFGVGAMTDTPSFRIHVDNSDPIGIMYLDFGEKLCQRFSKVTE